jgi:hypothetical protein
MKSRFGVRGVGLLAAVAVFAGGRAWAQDTKLPTAEEVINKSIEALGGQAEFAKIHNRVLKGILEVTGQPNKITLTIYEAEPNKRYSLTDVPGMGKVESGSDSNVCWQITPMGPAVLEGADRALALRQATFNDLLHWKQLYQKVECVALETVDEHACYKLVMTPAEGQGEPEIAYYDSKTYLPTKSVMTMKGPMGEMTLESVPSDFKKVDGVLLPAKLTQTQKAGPMSQTVSVTFDSVEQNVEIPADRFALPEPIKELLAKPKTETQPGTRPATASAPSLQEKP